MMIHYNNNWDILIGNDEKQTLHLAAHHWVELFHKSVRKKDRFAVALSGGNTPKMLYRTLATTPFKQMIDWRKIWLFWSDERNVIPSHPDSNYHMAMNTGLENMPIPYQQIFRMPAEHTNAHHAQEYENLIRKNLGSDLFDLVMLGLGKDGHIASLFPNSEGLNEQTKLVASYFVQQVNSCRMTLTYPCIEQSQHVAIYAWGEKKEPIIHAIFNEHAEVPAQRLSCKHSKIMWILDNFSAKRIQKA